MEINRFLFLLFLSLNVCHRARANVVVDLTEYTAEEFSLELQNHASIFVKFYTPTCPHCKSMAKDFALVARQLQEQDEAIVLAEVDCSHDAGEEICSKYGVVGFPTLKLFRYGSFYKNYNSQRNAKTMKNWLVNQIQGSSKVLQSVSELNALLEASETVTVAAVVISGQMKLLTHFLKASKRVKQHPQFADLQFYHLITEEPQTVWGSFSKDKPESRVSLHRPRWLQTPLETDKVSITLSLKHNLTDWVFNQTYGIIGLRTPKTDRNIHDPRTTGPLIVLFYDFEFRNSSNSAHHWRNQLIPFAREYKTLTFVISCSTDYSFYLKTKSLPVPGKSDPPVVMFYDSLTVPYAMTEEFAAQSFNKFLDTMMQPNDHLPRLRSNSTCPDNVNWTLTCMTGSDFKERISLNTKEVIIVVYKQVNDESITLVMKVGQFMTKVGSQGLEAFTLDASLNDVPQAFDSPDYPVIFYVSTTKKVLRIDRKFTDVLIAGMVREHLKRQQLKKAHGPKTEL